VTGGAIAGGEDVIFLADKSVAKLSVDNEIARNEIKMPEALRKGINISERKRQNLYG
jgi:hypothetical protein